MNKKTLQKYLKENHDRGVIDHELRAIDVNGKTTFYVHPKGVDGDTLDFEVSGNELKQLYNL